MFFSIGHQPLENYPCHWHMGSFCVSTDRGWQRTTLGTAQILYKGYADRAPLEDLLEQILFQTEPVLTGNFCALVLIDDTIEIQTDRYRSFPIYVGNGVNNLIPTSHTVWADSLITVQADLSVTETKFDVIGTIDVSPMSWSEALDNVANILDQKIISFLKHNRLPVRVFLSGGIDSMLVYSFVRKHTNNFELIKYSHIDYDYFWLKNSDDIARNWAYSQIHHWTDPCVLTSGTPGDEYMLRSPSTADLFLKYHGIKIADLLLQKKWANCLHYDHFCKSKQTNIFATQKSTSDSKQQLHWDLCNNVVNDWQHWHLGRTLTWTPLRDLEMFKSMLRLPADQIVDQTMNSKFSIELIERNCPGLSSALSPSKNSGNALSNLIKVYE